MEKKIDKYTFRVVTFLNRRELDFLDELAKDIYFTHGIHIPRTKLIEEIIEAFNDSRSISKKDIEKDLVRRFRDKNQESEEVDDE
ncbi:MAG: hypothetical protein JW867_05330 [Candidatus Omnitrophica bacterium]|nr:hypothetical protein [Candidatus Omnitrophota bacterium]